MTSLWIPRFMGLLHCIVLLMLCIAPATRLKGQTETETSQPIEAAKYQGPNPNAVEAASKKLTGAAGKIGVVRSHEIWSEYRGYNDISRQRRDELNAKLANYLNQFVGKDLKPSDLQVRSENWWDENGGIPLALREHREVGNFIAAFAKHRGYSVVIDLQVEAKPEPPKNQLELSHHLLLKSRLLYADAEVGEDITEELLKEMKKQRNVELGSVRFTRTAK